MTERAGSDRIPVATPPNLDGHDTPQAPASEPRGAQSWDRAGVIVTAVLAAVFVAAFVNALQWQAIAGLFPLTITGVGALLCLAFLVRSLTERTRRNWTAEAATATPDDGRPTEAGAVQQAEEAEELDGEHAFFASQGRRDWLVTLGWFGAFFVVLALAGMYLATVVFTVAYLRHQARTSWTLALAYAVVLAGAMYGLFGAALQLPVPEGLLGSG